MQVHSFQPTLFKYPLDRFLQRIEQRFQPISFKYPLNHEERSSIFNLLHVNTL